MDLTVRTFFDYQSTEINKELYQRSDCQGHQRNNVQRQSMRKTSIELSHELVAPTHFA